MECCFCRKDKAHPSMIGEEWQMICACGARGSFKPTKEAAKSSWGRLLALRVRKECTKARLNENEALVLDMIKDAIRYKRTMPTYPDIMQKLGVSKNMPARYLKKLVEKKHIRMVGNNKETVELI